jgi:hypothetical protein
MGKERHNHQIKPVALFEYLIKTYTSVGDRVINRGESGTSFRQALHFIKKYVKHIFK